MRRSPVVAVNGIVPDMGKDIQLVRGKEARSSGCSLVVVDDAFGILTVLDCVLKKEGYSVNTFTGAAAALAFVEKNPVHLVISDFRMPEMDGVEFVRALRAAGWKGVFYFLSGYAEELNGVDLKGLGVAQILSKPVDQFTLMESIQRSLGACLHSF